MNRLFAGVAALLITLGALAAPAEARRAYCHVRLRDFPPPIACQAHRASHPGEWSWTVRLARTTH